MRARRRRSPLQCATDRIAELELVRDSLARQLADAIAECEQLRRDVARAERVEVDA